MRNLIILLLCIIFISCRNKETKKQSDNERLGQLTALPESDVLQRLAYQKNKIDSLFKENEDKVILLAKINDKIVQIDEDFFSEDIGDQYSVLKGDNKNIILISKLSVHDYILYSHYFDENGKTFAFEQQESFYNKDCSSFNLTQHETEFFSTDFKPLGTQILVKDEREDTIKNCNKLIEGHPIISSDIQSYLKSNTITNFK